MTDYVDGEGPVEVDEAKDRVSPPDDKPLEVTTDELPEDENPDVKSDMQHG